MSEPDTTGNHHEPGETDMPTLLPLSEYGARLVAEAPPLTPELAARIAALLPPVTRRRDLTAEEMDE